MKWKPAEGSVKTGRDIGWALAATILGITGILAFPA
jgi:hypothetical protein